MNATSKQIKNNSYESLINSTNVETDNYDAIKLYPERTEAYDNLVLYYTEQATDVDSTRIDKLINQVDNNVKSGYLDSDNGDVANLYYGLGKLKFYKADAKSDSPLNGVKDAKEYFRKAADSNSEFEKKRLAEIYYDMSVILTANPNGMLEIENDYEGLINKINNNISYISNMDKTGKPGFDQISLYYIALLFVDNQAKDMAENGISKDTVVRLMRLLRDESEKVFSSLPYVTAKKEAIEKNYDIWLKDIDIAYSTAENKGGN